jgi:hypothetical protein
LGRPIPQLYARLVMCDRDSANIAAEVWATRTYRGPKRTCKDGSDALQVAIGGNWRVRNALLPWIARGWLRGEKLEQYFEAEARCRRARRS